MYCISDSNCGHSLRFDPMTEMYRTYISGDIVKVPGLDGRENIDD